MSKIGRKPIALPAGVTIKLEEGKVLVSGSKGDLSVAVPKLLKLVVQDNTVRVAAPSGSNEGRRMQGLVRNLIANAVVGVSEGFVRQLEMKGTGFRAEVQDTTLILTVGFSHPVSLAIPEGLTLVVERATGIMISGIDKQLVGAFAAKIRAARPPEPYKGKGIKYLEEVIKRKPGKAAKAATAA